MELTKQVPQKDLCKRMDELGWNKETFFYWTNQFSLDERWQTPEKNKALKEKYLKEFHLCEKVYLYHEILVSLSHPNSFSFLQSSNDGTCFVSSIIKLICFLLSISTF